MKTCSSDMRRSALIILMINSFCAFSQIPHEVVYVVGCFENGTTEAVFEFDAEELLYVDFDRDEVVYTMPRFLTDDPSKLFENLNVFNNAKKNRNICLSIIKIYKLEENNPPEEMDPPESILYPSEEVQLGVENSLICFVNHFYPPEIKVSWTRNGRLVSEGQSLSRYYPNNDQTFHQFTTLTFTPKEGDIYSCTVEHLALDRPKTRSWVPDFSHPSLGPGVYCGVGLTVGLLGVAVGTFLMVKGCRGQ
ncbi:H-2 class II histocompatibility antigen, A-U alpha chain-like [Cyclopterus lumpus]|uniref:Ig-like domain-containing protein n=1 Tax=Cyclopterus lumpus TaxID=8103 RepID=A0A8C2X0I5_CYCLU|nr:H-2 class II histocompatibility antigen, A-U alpha chain-like [Cyclopterus lumpus]XP_034409869.1 H-2 class II histocompatibility antigen, A-U alpha chain-like [Cyclopterus lumpus]XP_034409870.1 H-2 class II histocompatibility antigen, A-U alpha chain-like [Cyclopterus lumpus]